MTTTVTERPVTIEHLRWLARNWDTVNIGARVLLLGGLTNPDLDPPPRHGPCHGCGACLQCVWDGYRHDLAMLDGLRREIWAAPVRWQDMDGPDLNLRDAEDPEAEAAEIMGQHVADGEDRLTGIPARVRAGAA